MIQKEHPRSYHLLSTILPATLFSTNYNKTHKFRLKYEIKYIIYEKMDKNNKT